MLKKYSKQRGQTIILYALMIPLLFSFIGVTADFGWRYFNESRLQNAADAAVLAGANEIVSNEEEQNIKSRKVIDFVSEKELDNFSDGDKISKFANGNSAALSYANKNSFGETFENNKNFKDYTYGENPMYYVVELTGKANHLFNIMEKFGDMNIRAKAAAKISFNLTEDEAKALEELQINKVIIGNWEIQNYYKSKLADYEKFFGHSLFVGKWNHFKEPSKKIEYKEGNVYRTEKITVRDGKELTTPANGNKKYNWDELESINIDFAQDVNFGSTITSDWDIGMQKPEEAKTLKAISNGNTNLNAELLNYRVHTYINFDEPYKTRPNEENTDFLFARIESEPMWSKVGPVNSQLCQLNSVRQIFLNMNKSNDADQYRPLIIFYDGPESNADNPYLSESERPAHSNIRDSQPVILNLKENFKGILFMPNSPVIITGDGSFRGFIVAKEYLSLKTDNDVYYDSANEKYYSDTSKTKEYFKVNNVYVDKNGNVQTKPYTGNLKYGTFDSLGIKAFDDYEVNTSSQNNLFTIAN